MVDHSRSSVKITDLKAAQHIKRRKNWNRTLVKVETDSGLTGFGEIGSNGQIARGQIHQMEDLLLGEDPLEVRKLYDRMMRRQHSHRAHVPTIGGVDIALWDLAGKILGYPVSKLLGGQCHKTVPLYLNSRPDDALDPTSCQEWADDLKDDPDGPTVVKVGFDQVIETKSPERVDEDRWEKQPLKGTELAVLERAARNVREALGDELDFIVHCHNEWDLPSAIGFAEAVAPANPLWLEDPLPVEYSNNWQTLSQKAPCRILTGEKLEAVQEFEPFIVNGAIDIVQPDLVFAGGITGCQRIARLADQHYLPMTAHNTGGLIQNAATVHFASSVQNFWMTETKLPQSEEYRQMGNAPGLEVENGAFHVPTEPGLGVTLNNDAIYDMLLDGEAKHWT